MRRTGLIFLASLPLFMSAAWAAGPLPAPKQYVTPNYGLTFSTPAGSSFCPLPEGWVGSDHGTMLFLDRPQECGGAGYPSIDRGFSPDSTPRIEVYYAYWMDEDEPKSPHCKMDGWANLMGQRRAICVGKRGDLITEETEALYLASSASKVVVTLVTTPTRRERDLATFRALTASMHSCATEFKDVPGKTDVVGTGQACPPGGWF